VSDNLRLKVHKFEEGTPKHLGTIVKEKSPGLLPIFILKHSKTVDHSTT